MWILRVRMYSTRFALVQQTLSQCGLGGLDDLWWFIDLFMVPSCSPMDARKFFFRTLERSHGSMKSDSLTGGCKEASRRDKRYSRAA